MAENRLSAANDLGIEPVFKDFDKKRSAFAYVIQKNVLHRNHTKEQVVAYALEYYGETDGGVDDPPPLTNSKLVKETGASLDVVKAVKSAIRNGCPMMLELIQKGKIGATAAKKLNSDVSNKADQQALLVRALANTELCLTDAIKEEVKQHQNKLLQTPGVVPGTTTEVKKTAEEIKKEKDEKKISDRIAKEVA